MKLLIKKTRKNKQGKWKFDLRKTIYFNKKFQV